MNKSEMADEALFLLLHNEMVSGLYRAAEQGDGVSVKFLLARVGEKEGSPSRFRFESSCFNSSSSS